MPSASEPVLTSLFAQIEKVNVPKIWSLVTCVK